MSNPIQFPRRTFLAMPLAFAACKPNADVIELSGATMGTAYKVVALDPGRSVEFAAVQQAIDVQLAAVNNEMSNWDPNSEVSRFNASVGDTPVPVSDGLAQVLDAANHVHEASLGHFDVTVGKLVDLWGFGAGTSGQRTPTDAEIDAARSATGQGNVLRLGAKTLRKTTPDAQIYLSAIGKGHGVDRVAEALEALGLTDFMVEIGGDLRTRGTNPDGLPWQIGVETPERFDRRVHKVVALSNQSLATSGDYRNYFDAEGVRYSHIIDPATGRPVTHATASATVIAETAMLADAWATAMLTMGQERGLEVAAAHDIAVAFIERTKAGSKYQLVTRTSAAFDHVAT